jgi:hypothetical protein
VGTTFTVHTFFNSAQNTIQQPFSRPADLLVAKIRPEQHRQETRWHKTGLLCLIPYRNTNPAVLFVLLYFTDCVMPTHTDNTFNHVSEYSSNATYEINHLLQLISKGVFELIFPSSVKQNPDFRPVIRMHTQRPTFNDTLMFTTNGL